VGWEGADQRIRTWIKQLRRSTTGSGLARGLLLAPAELGLRRPQNFLIRWCPITRDLISLDGIRCPHTEKPDHRSGLGTVDASAFKTAPTGSCFTAINAMVSGCRPIISWPVSWGHAAIAFTTATLTAPGVARRAKGAATITVEGERGGT